MIKKKLMRVIALLTATLGVGVFAFTGCSKKPSGPSDNTGSTDVDNTDGKGDTGDTGNTDDKGDTGNKDDTGDKDDKGDTGDQDETGNGGGYGSRPFGVRLYGRQRPWRI